MALRRIQGCAVQDPTIAPSRLPFLSTPYTVASRRCAYGTTVSRAPAGRHSGNVRPNGVVSSD